MFINESKKILKNKDGQDAIIEVFELLYDCFENDKDKLSQSQIDFMLVTILEMEVNSGGFDSFYWNSYGDYSYETLDALKRMGSKIYSDIMLNSINVFKDEIILPNQTERQSYLEKLGNEAEEEFDKLDIKFLRYEENIHSLLIEHIKK